MDLTVNALKVLHARYLLKDESGRVVESPREMFGRVARAVAQAEEQYGGSPQQAGFEGVAPEIILDNF
jgi:ribonucleoside-diphosphate reductase alpha chain